MIIKVDLIERFDRNSVVLVEHTVVVVTICVEMVEEYYIVLVHHSDDLVQIEYHKQFVPQEYEQVNFSNLFHWSTVEKDKQTNDDYSWNSRIDQLIVMMNND